MNLSTLLIAALAATPIVKVTTVSYGHSVVETAPMLDMQYTSGVLTISRQGDGIFRNSFE